MNTETKSSMFEVLKMRYEKKFVRKDQLQKFVSFGSITAEEYKEITSEDLPA
ncbi:MAG: XkdX family protein [Anaerotignum propionicum]|uniref:XkdX family protein n=1 Tax=Anaerotignum propionicum TaxID=28446 RepID=UPI002B20C259|nr:XkdX family protein [Anaerotignum propionicum]MEA5057146.1 XkdX family protein [Anaerotignum propionicum]